MIAGLPKLFVTPGNTNNSEQRLKIDCCVENQPITQPTVDCSAHSVIYEDPVQDRVEKECAM